MDAPDSRSGTLTIPLAAWSVIGIVVALFLLRAVGDNPAAFYIHLRWLVLVAAGTGFVVSYRIECLGWSVLMLAAAILYNPAFMFRLARPTWVVVNLATATAFLVFALALLGHRLPWVIGARDLLDGALLVAVGAAWGSVLLQALWALLMILLSYIVHGDESLADTWYAFRSEHVRMVHAVAFVGAFVSLAVPIWRRKSVRGSSIARNVA